MEREIGRQGCVAHIHRRHQLRSKWAEGMKTIILSKTEAVTSGRITDGGEEAAVLLSKFGWMEGTWNNRTSLLLKCLMFCDEEGR